LSSDEQPSSVEPTLSGEPPPPLELEGDFGWYMDADADIVVACFPFGAGVGEPQIAQVGRQLAETFAQIFRLHSAFITVPQLLLVSESVESLEHTRIRSAFAVFHSLPQTRIVRQTARSFGARLAVTGRLLGEGNDFLFGVNVLDVERNLLLGCTQVQIPRDLLLDAVVDIGTHLLRRFVAVDADAMARQVSEIVGTRKLVAYTNWALACELQRRTLGEQVDERRLVERLGFALGADPLFLAPLQALVQLLEQTEDDRVLAQIARSLAKIPISRPATGLVRAEALRRQGEVELAREALQDVIDQHPHTAQAHYLLGCLEEPIRPGAALRHFTEAHLLDPKRSLYKEKVNH